MTQDITQGKPLSGKRILVVGGTSGIGFGTAQAAVEAGASVVIASRSAQKISAAVARLGDATCGAPLDTSDEAGIDAFFTAQAPFDHVVVSAAQTKVAAIRDLALAHAYRSMNSKFWGAYRVARAARITAGGSLTFVSGYLSVRPKKGAAIQGAINAALEGLTRGLALEFAPVRVNCVSPGLVMTELYDALEGDARQAMFDGAAARLPAGLVGTPAHIAIQIIAFITNPYITGSTVYVDGGGAIA
ncbi:MAG: SDR family oxidoreductase [Pseudomonadota bacterium]|uniref:SDR family oxidoreductase n=1 Tax=Paraburkholderia TaxID=1822464 RepID=UPI0001441683|nr:MULTISPECIES: SDR family oxidoreductase [Paraburkholderia]PNE56663.1 SDR family oxidoreductase [Paraburkholderia fungorum]USU14496.1 SDR family oxidoreductase [Paraburkholderia fungorum]USU22444.1 SDR family oxidoreductase [Paraburkholderia fungorum]